MSTATSSPSSCHRTRRLPKSKSPKKRASSASEIAKNANHFETWSNRQNVERVLFSDIPKEIKGIVDDVMNVSERIPLAWLDESTKSFKLLSRISSTGFIEWLREAEQALPEIFTSKKSSSVDSLAPLYDELAIVYRAWKALRDMKSSADKISEAEFAAAYGNVTLHSGKTLAVLRCTVFRKPAVVLSHLRPQCSISLPQPFNVSKLSSDAVRVLSAKEVKPDNAVFPPRTLLKELSESASSPFKALKSHLRGTRAESGASFSSQCTPCSSLPEPPGFEFASSIWEDKKPYHSEPEDAYRQNRMSVAATVRQMHSFGIHIPVFGLVWCNGTVRAHVDWCQHPSGDTPATIHSAPFPGKTGTTFHEWHLERPSDILQVHLFIRNIDYWTCNGFADAVVAGVKALQKSIVIDGGSFMSWKRVGTFKSTQVCHTRRRISEDGSEDLNASPPTQPKTRVRKGKTVAKQ